MNKPVNSEFCLLNILSNAERRKNFSNAVLKYTEQKSVDLGGRVVVQRDIKTVLIKKLNYRERFKLRVPKQQKHFWQRQPC